MQYYNYIFILLCFRNGSDVPSFIESIKGVGISSFRIVLVNSYFDDETENEIHRIAEDNDCDYYSIENKGYGFGNNFGIQKALSNYSFDYLIVANSDMLINTFDETCLSQNAVYAPLIRTLSGKSQNPYFVINNPFSEWLIYKGHRGDFKHGIFFGQAINKVLRELFLLWFRNSSKTKYNVYAAHGSFIIIPIHVLQEITPVFDENMFLFYEEAYLANKLYSLKIPIVLCKHISLTHFEDGSTKGSNIDLSPNHKISFLYYYENYRKNKG